MGREPLAGELRIACQQHASVPDARLLALLMRKMRIDLGAPRSRERPVPGFELEIKGRDAMNAWERHARFISHSFQLFS